MTFWDVSANILLVFLFVLLNGFFVAAEFAIVKIRLTQLEAQVQKGNLRARLARDIVTHLDAYLSATQLGITMTSLALGWVGEPLVASMLHPVFAAAGIGGVEIVEPVSFGVAFTLITFFHIVLGELAPKSLAIQRTYGTTMMVSYPLRGFFFVFRPIIILLNTLANGVLRILGIHPASETEIRHSEEELRLILASEPSVSPLSRSVLLNAMDFRRKQARHVMVPRREMVALSIDATPEESIAAMRATKFSRLPVYRDSPDNVLGLVITKEIFKTDRHLRPDFSVASVMRDAVFLPETATLEKTLSTMLHRRTHMILLADEYGGTAGLVTLENVLEEIVGPIQDEFDREAPEVVKISDDEYVVDGSVTTNDVERTMNTELSPMDIRSIGGFVTEALGRIPKVGETVRAGGLELTAEKVVENAVESVRVKRIPPPPDEPA